MLEEEVSDKQGEGATIICAPRTLIEMVRCAGRW